MPSAFSPQTRFGGAPPIDGRFSWPACSTCERPLPFLGQVRSPDAKHLHLIFMCEGDIDGCCPWDADGGANAVVCVDADTVGVAAGAPVSGGVRCEPYGSRVECVEVSHYNEARTLWSERNPGRRREVLGQIGGEADWLNFDGTPDCDHCRRPMRFVAQLEAGPDHETEMNFGGGCGYLFECACAGGSGKFLWQST
jgi:hypothetical protein